MSGVSKSNDTPRNRLTLGSFGMPNDTTPEYSDKGGASRFFYCAKASKAERNAGLSETQELSLRPLGILYNEYSGVHSEKRKGNFHPTVKPIKLMEYLVKLVTPKNGIVLDPFMGSGTTAIACVKNNFKFIGFEKETEYKEIADARIGKELQQKKLGDV
jgi:DNA modification methylase